ncbi:hypothetical protein Chor_011218 [Crotalus horridus]
MASKQLDPEGENEEEEGPEADLHTQYSDSSYVSESPEMCGGGGGGGHPTPEDENRASVYSMKSQELDFDHLVTCTFSVSLAVPLTLPITKPWQSSKPEIQRSGSKAKEGFIPKMHRFYHMEYFLLPDDIEPRKLDLVLFGPVAKLFLDTESKVVKPWLENDQIWVSWNHSIEINITNEFLIKLREHSIKLRLWDTKEKVCSKARFCKLKSNVPLSDQGEFEGNVKNMVLYQREFLQRNEAKPSITKVKPLAPFVRKQTDALSAVSKRMENEPKASDQKYSRKFSFPQPLVKSDDSNRSLSTLSFSGSIESSFKEKTIQEGKTIKQKHRASLSIKTNGGKSPISSDRKERVSIEKRRPSQKGNVFSADKKSKQAAQRSAGKEAAALAAQARKFGIAVLRLDLMPLLAGEYYIVSRWEENSPKLNEAYLGFAIDKPIMSEKHKHDLNPLIIKIKSAKCLPNTPVPIEELQRTCTPVYCKYTFYNMCPHYTQGRDHGTDVFFKDINVILVGTIDPGKFSEYLKGPDLEIEVHDRDKKMEDLKMKPSLFGEEPGDSKLSDISYVTSRYMVQNSITAKENICSLYGVTKINLSNLLLGEKTLNFCAPIHNSSVQDTSLFHGQNTSPGAKKTDDSQVVQFPNGNYVNAESYLKVRVEISVPLGPAEEEGAAAAAHCPYGCIIYLFDYNNTSFLHYLMQEITEINAEAFLLDSYPIDTTQKSLNTLKLNHKLSLEEISLLDIITGFHIIDGSIHLLVLEGFRNKALKRMWNKKIDRLDYICHSKKLREVIHYNLLPSAEMITMLSQEFGVPLTKADMYAREPPEILESFNKMQKDPSMRQYGCSHLDNHNEKYVLRKKEQESQAPRNYIQSNIEYVNFLNEIFEREIPRTIRAFPFGENAIFNYSCQALNSAEIAKKLLRQEMAKARKQDLSLNFLHVFS